MKKCKSCGNELVKNAKICPSCGVDPRNFFQKHKIISGLGILMLLSIIMSAGTTESSAADTQSKETEQVQKETETTDDKKEPEVSQEYKNALKKAEGYSSMDMSKAAIYDQLTSEYGENFPEDAAQYAVDNLEADFNANALNKAKTYYTDMGMSKNDVYDQLISDYGEQFTEEQAQYAVDNLE